MTVSHTGAPILVLLALLLVSWPGDAVPGRSGPSVSNDQQTPKQNALKITVEKIVVEIARVYVQSRGMPFPKQIKSVPALTKFLEKNYPDENHELRLAVSGLLKLGGQLAEEGDADIAESLRKGVLDLAVDLNGKPFKYDQRKIEQLISEGIKPQISSHQRKAESERPRESETPTAAGRDQGGPTDFVRRYAVSLLSGMVILNLILVGAVVRLKRRLRAHVDPGKPAQPRPSSLNATPPIVTSQKNATSPGVTTEKSATPSVVTTQKSDNPPVPTNQAVTANAGGEPKASTGVARSDGWLVVRTSVPGKLHVESNPQVPCQDSSNYEYLRNSWGIGVVCDGAGSRKFSHLGSEFVARKASRLFVETIEKNRWIEKEKLPSEAQWKRTAKDIFQKLKVELDKFTQDTYSIGSDLFGCTVIVLIHSPLGILAAHVGDGRAAFCNGDNEWKAVMRPFKGEEANQTIFITSIDGHEPDEYVETRIFKEEPKAFTLMSDGCEAHSFEVNIFDQETQKYLDPNRPYAKFFQPLLTTLRQLHDDEIPNEQIGCKWEQFIKMGTENLKNEPDDKSMILGAFVR